MTTTSHICIRPANQADALDIASMADELRRTLGDEPGHLTRERILADGFGSKPEFEILIADLSQAPDRPPTTAVAGYALFTLAYEPTYAAKGLYLADLFVRPTHRRLGIATALIESVSKRALEQGRRYVGLATCRRPQAGNCLLRQSATTKPEACARSSPGPGGLAPAKWLRSMRPMRSLSIVAFLLPVIFASSKLSAAELSRMYPREVLLRDAERLKTAALKIYELGIKPTLTRKELAGVGEVEFRFPMPKPGDDPMNFYAYRQDNRAVVVMPVLSLKAVEDLTTAYAWIQKRGYKHDTLDIYYAMLRHRRPEDFPNGRYPDVLSALGIPEKAYEEEGVDTLSLALRNEAFAFILTHELGHVLFRHKGYGSITRAQARADEEESDRFALDVLARSGTSPLGAVFYFQAQVYRFRHRGEFASDDDYQDYLDTVATHPTTIDRIKAMAGAIGELAYKRAAREKQTWRAIAGLLGNVAAILADRDMQRCIAQVARTAPYSVLRPATTDTSSAMVRACLRQ